ncbi:glycosyltransferase [Chryseolinea sp. T2]|uniref:glycosyltransferase n=1 Tax=Chryseolinea sp. T2 TaxID=3129255 RepID=UPI0030771914
MAINTHSVSIVVCCYNSARRIGTTLRYLSKIIVPASFKVEVLIVDNASTDDTAQTALKTWRNCDRNEIEFRVVHEENPGLANARMRGIRESQSDYIVFCDDDNHLDEGYLVGAFAMLDRDSTIGILGGYSQPKFSIKGREWLKDFFTALAVGDERKQSGFQTWVFGAGIVIRKKVFDLLEKRSIKFQLSDRKGKAVSSGGDAEICCMARFLGFKVYYSSEITFHHEIPENRLERKYYLFPNLLVIDDIVHLYILENIVEGSLESALKLRSRFLSGALKELLYFAPRMAFGGRQFYSFCMFYQRLQSIYWLSTKGSTFTLIYDRIQRNLKGESPGEYVRSNGHLLHM